MVGRAFGYALFLPEGYALTTEGAAELPAPPARSDLEAVRFASATRGARGLLLVDRSGQGQLISGCQRTLKRLGGVEAPVPVEGGAPACLGRSALLYGFNSTQGARGLLACAVQPDGRLVSLAIVAKDPASELAAVGAGLTLK